MEATIDSYKVSKLGVIIHAVVRDGFKALECG